ncbi:TPM domain-containing protein [Labrys okinawensis]|uniref:TPM domain-containing protein n=1 Tax=Labrys okinawensis TaxID=346911 RepID=UPI0039BC9EEB
MPISRSAFFRLRWWFCADLEIGTPICVALALAFLLLASPAFALTFPPLTGRVVDQANIIPAAERASLEQSLQALEQKSSDQLVVATLSSLQGTDIADYGYQLGRAWGIGQGKLNNGVLLIVAPNERKVRIEVGYGLEGTLTDALSSVIIQQAILPKFKAGDMAGGIQAGVAAIQDTLLNDESEWKQRARDGAQQQDQGIDPQTLFIIIFFILVIFIIVSGWINNTRGGPGGPGALRRRGSGPIFIPTSGWGGGSSWGGGGGGGGGFSGGGGSFGGGGSSGSW